MGDMGAATATMKRQARGRRQEVQPTPSSWASSSQRRRPPASSSTAAAALAIAFLVGVGWGNVFCPRLGFCPPSTTAKSDYNGRTAELGKTTTAAENDRKDGSGDGDGGDLDANVGGIAEVCGGGANNTIIKPHMKDCWQQRHHDEQIRKERKRSMQKEIASEFMKNEFSEYRAVIDREMEATYRSQSGAAVRPECQGSLYRGEFGLELQAMPPWANYRREVTCAGEPTSTAGVAGTRYAYYFSGRHDVDTYAERRGNAMLPQGNPFRSKSGHIHNIPDGAEWRPPPYKDFFRRPEMEKILAVVGREEGKPPKPLVVILNKYTQEWGRPPTNYFSIPVLVRMLDYLTPKYTVLYKRHTTKGLEDLQERTEQHDLNEKEMMRDEYPDVLFFEDFDDELNDVDDSNLLLFGFLSLSKRFLTVQGGTAAVGSYFGGTNIILIKKGKELQYGDYNYFHRLSNATVISKMDDDDFLEEMKRNM